MCRTVFTSAGQPSYVLDSEHVLPKPGHRSDTPGHILPGKQSLSTAQTGLRCERSVLGCCMCTSSVAILGLLSLFKDYIGLYWDYCWTNMHIYNTLVVGRESWKEAGPAAQCKQCTLPLLDIMNTKVIVIVVHRLLHAYQYHACLFTIICIDAHLTTNNSVQ